MSDSKKDDKKDDKKEAPVAAKPSKVGAILGVVLPAVFAGGAAFGGAKVAGAGHQKTVVVEVPAAPKPPGPTLPLEAFLVTLSDTSGKPHAMKVVLAIEFSNTTKEEVLKPLVPRVRDAALGYLRTVSFDLASDRTKGEVIRKELLEHIKKSGAATAEQVLITDFVLQ